MNNDNENTTSQLEDTKPIESNDEPETCDAHETSETINVDDVLSKLANKDDAILRLQAELQNTQRRAERDIAKAHKFALDRFVNELLPVLDSLEHAIDAIANEPDKEGVSLTYNMLTDTLKKFNIIQVNPKGQPFNPEHHEAMTMIESADAEPNTVIDVFQKGYLLNERLVRPARVTVAKAPSTEPEEK